MTDDLTATVRNWSPNTAFYNLDITNTYGKGAQALALSANAGNQAYYACSFTSYQDTVLAENGVQIYAKSYVEGATDFIFGQHATAWFDGVDIGLVATSKGTITASGRPSSSDPSWYVLNKCSVAAAAGQSVPAGAYYLGRPWAAYARVVVQETSMTDAINTAGWVQWNAGDPRTADVTFEEYGNTGAGASGTRASFAKEIGGAVGVATVLGSGYASWVDATYLS